MMKLCFIALAIFVGLNTISAKHIDTSKVTYGESSIY